MIIILLLIDSIKFLIWVEEVFVNDCIKVVGICGVLCGEGMFLRFFVIILSGG